MQKSTSIFFSLLILTMLTTAGMAQEPKNKGKLPDVQGSLLTLKMHSTVKLENTDAEVLTLPSELTKFLDSQESLATLNVDMLMDNSAKKRSVQFKASYVFADLAAYNKWRQRKETKAFFKALRNSYDGRISMSIAMIRSPLNEIVKKYADDN